VAFVAVGDWSYAEFLSDLAHRAGLALPVPVRLLLYIALLGGTVLGGWTAGRIQFTAPSVGSLIRCVFGGAMMGAAATLIPGGKIGLILAGMPLLWRYAWLAFASVCVTIYVAIRITGMETIEQVSATDAAG
jgi:hypothetical protein